MKLETIEKACAERQKEYYKDGKQRPSLSFHGLQLGGETGELLNLVKKREREKMGIAGKSSAVSQEELENGAADVLISLINLCFGLNIDLISAARNKFNSDSRALGFKTFLRED